MAISSFTARLPLGREPFDASNLLSIDPELCRGVDELRVWVKVEKLQVERLPRPALNSAECQTPCEDTTNTAFQSVLDGPLWKRRKA